MQRALPSLEPEVNMDPTQIESTGDGPLDELASHYAQLNPDTKDVVDRAHDILGLHPLYTDSAVNQAAQPPLARTATLPLASSPEPSTAPQLGRTAVLRPMPEVSVPSVPPTATDATAQAPIAPATTPEVSATANPEQSLPVMMPRSQMAAPSRSAMQTPAQGELSRLQAVPLGRGDPNAHTAADTGRAGVDQVHSPWARVPLQILDAIGSGLFPRIAQFIPGTSAHRDYQVLPQAESAVTNENAEQVDADKTAQDTAQTKETEARAAEEQAHAAELTNPTKALTPKDKYMVVGDGIFDAEHGAFLPGHEPTDKKLAEVTEIDPEKGKALGLTPNKDGKYIVPNAALGGLLRPTAPTKAPQWSAEDAALLRSVGGDPDKPETQTPAVMKKYRDLKTEHIVAPADHGVSFIDPSTHKLVRVEPNGVVPEGALTPTQTGQVTEATSKTAKGKQEAATQAQDAYETAQELAKDQTGASDVGLSMQFIGAVKPESMGKIRFTPQEQNFVMGTRSSFGDLTALAEKVANGQKLIPKQRDEMLRTMKIFADAAKRNSGSTENGKAGGATENVRKYNPATGKLE